MARKKTAEKPVEVVAPEEVTEPTAEKEFVLVEVIDASGRHWVEVPKE